MITKTAVASGLIMGLALATHGAVLANYELTADLSADTSDANVTANDFAEGASFAGSGDAGRSGSGQNLFAKTSLTAGGESGSLAGAISAEDYFSFTIDVHSGFAMDLTSLDLNAGYTSSGGAATGKTVTAALLTSADGFNAGNLLTNISSVVTLGQASPQYQAWSIDLSGSSFQDLTGSVEFRLYLYDDASDANIIHRLDDVVLNGTVATTSGSVIVSYDLQDDLSASMSATNIMAGDITEGTSFAGSGDAGRSGSGQNLFARASLTAGGGSGSLGGAITAGDYFAFIITPAFGMSLTALELRAGYTSSGGVFSDKTVTASLLTSVDGFTAGDLVADTSSVVALGESSPQYQAWSINLAGASFQDLTDPVEFRLYLHDDTSDDNIIHRLDDVVLFGSVRPPPKGTVLVLR